MVHDNCRVPCFSDLLSLCVRDEGQGTRSESSAVLRFAYPIRDRLSLERSHAVMQSCSKAVMQSGNIFGEHLHIDTLAHCFFRRNVFGTLSLFIVHCSLFIIHCLLFIVRCSLFIVH